MRIRDNVIFHIKQQVGLKAQLCAAFNKHFGTVERWINKNEGDGPLTTIKALDIIKRETGFSEEEILDKEAVTN